MKAPAAGTPVTATPAGMGAAPGPNNADPDAQAELETLGTQGSRLVRILWAPSVWTLTLLIVTIIIFSLLQPSAFLSWLNARNIGINAASILIMAVGETFVLSAQGLDLSVGSVLVLSSVLGVRTFDAVGGSGLPTMLAGFVVCIGVGLSIGILNGVLTAKLRVPPLVVTLGTNFAAQGLAYVISGGVDLRDVPDGLVNTIGYSSVLNIPYLVIIAFVVAVVASLVYYTTRFGRYTVVIGSNPEAALRAGIRVSRHVIKLYAVSGTMAGLAGFLSLAQYGSTQIGSHQSDFLYVLLAVILGGTSFYGGVGSMVGTCFGVLVPWVLNFGLVVEGIDSYWQPVALGVIFVVVVYFDALRRKAREGVRH